MEIKTELADLDDAIEVKGNVQDWQTCAELCHNDEDCHRWSWVSDSDSENHLNCHLLGNPQEMAMDSNANDKMVSGNKSSWDCVLEHAHKFAGVEIQDDLRLTGLLGGHDLLEFKDVFYKSKENVISGMKNFYDVSVENDIIKAGKINGSIDLSNNLIFLTGSKTVVGDFTFNEVELKNLQVNGLIDGVSWADLLSDRLLRDKEQTISAKYTFGPPTKSIHFKGGIVGDGDDDNGLGFLNEQKVESIRVAEDVWSTVGAVKVAAQVEARVLCQHVKDLNSAYLNNLNVDFFEEITKTLIAPAEDFDDILQMDTIRIDKEVYLIVLTASKILTGRVTDSSVEHLKVHPIDQGRNKINTACALSVFSDEMRKSHDGSFAVLSNEGLTSFNMETTSETTITRSNFVSHVSHKSHPCKIGCIHEIQSCFVALQDEVSDKFRMRIVQMNPSVDSVDIWMGEVYSVKISSPNFDVIKIKETVFFAISDQNNHPERSYLTLVEANVTYPSQVKFSVVRSTSVSITEHDFVLIAPRRDPLIVAAKREEVGVVNFCQKHNSHIFLFRLSL